jgi:Na+/proline symporter
VALFLLIALSIGVYAGRKIKTINDYIQYYKNYSPAILGLSLMMVIFGSGTISGTVSEIITVGIIYAIASFGYVINSFISAKYIIPKMDHRFDGMISACDIFKYFFDYRAEKFSAIIAFIFDVGAAGTQLLALGKIMSHFLSIDYKLGLALTGGIMVIYSTLGGIRTVTIMDVIKCVLLLIFIPILASVVTFKAGGFMYIISQTNDTRLLVFDHPDFFKYLILFIFFMAPVHMFQPIVVQRLLMINDSKTASKAMFLYGLLRSVLIWMMIAIALASLVLIPNISAKEALFSTVLTSLPPIIKGFTITSIIAIVMCKADAHLNSSGIILANNLLPNRIRKMFTDLTTIRWCTFIIGLTALSLALMDFAIIKIIVFIESLWGLCIGLPLIAGIIGFKVNKRLFWLYINAIIPLFIFVNLFISEYYTPLLLLIIGIIIFSFLYYYCIYKNKHISILDFKNLYNYGLFYLKKLINNIPTLNSFLKYSAGHL